MLNKLFLVGSVLLASYGAGGTRSMVAQSVQLHAGIRVNLMQAGQHGKPDHVQISFVLVNDSDTVIPVDRTKWKFIIDGAEVRAFNLGAGVGASADDHSLASGQ